MYTYKIYVCVNNQINTFETIKKWAKLNGIKIEPMLYLLGFICLMLFLYINRICLSV